jgi:hypothetical protein
MAKRFIIFSCLSNQRVALAILFVSLQKGDHKIVISGLPDCGEDALRGEALLLISNLLANHVSPLMPSPDGMQTTPAPSISTSAIGPAISIPWGKHRRSVPTCAPFSRTYFLAFVTCIRT